MARVDGADVIGMFNNVYAVRILRLSTHAMIEAGVGLADAASELDAVFLTIAHDAVAR